jgi:DNA-binding SARP family transcriptional activator
MPPPKIHLFGRFSIAQDGRELECIQSGKAKELFCYLLLHRDRPHSREVLASLLWENCAAFQARKYFRQALWQVQHGVRDLFPGSRRPLVQVDGEHVRLNSPEESWLDVSVFEKAFIPVRGLRGEQMSQQQAHTLRNAVALYRGDLLEGWFYDWCLYQRERLQGIYVATLDKLMAYSEYHRAFEDGLSFGELLLRQDNARERTYCRLMRLHYLAGDRVGALRQFQRCASALQTELGVKPAKHTLELYEQIRTDHLETPNTHILESSKQTTLENSGPPLLPRLKGLRSLLIRLQSRLERDIREVDRTLASHVERPQPRKE